MSENYSDPASLTEKPRTKVKLGDHERPGLDHTLYTAPDKPPDTIGTDPEDNLPRPFAATSIKDAEAPAMSPQTFVCMADRSLYVVRDRWGKIVGRFAPEIVSFAEDGTARVSFSQAFEAAIPLLDLVRSRRGRWCVVEPVRPQCKNYRRQLRPWQGDDTVQHCIRYCAALHDEHGELVSLNDETLLACELRQPQSWETMEQIDSFDERVVASGVNAEETEFNVDEELGKAGGIFSQEG